MLGQDCCGFVGEMFVKCCWVGLVVCFYFDSEGDWREVC